MMHLAQKLIQAVTGVIHHVLTILLKIIIIYAIKTIMKQIYQKLKKVIIGGRLKKVLQ